MTPYQEFMSAEFERMLSADWSKTFSKEQAIDYARKMYSTQKEYTDELVTNTPAWKNRFPDKQPQNPPKQQNQPKASA